MTCRCSQHTRWAAAGWAPREVLCLRPPRRVLGCGRALRCRWQHFPNAVGGQPHDHHLRPGVLDRAGHSQPVAPCGLLRPVGLGFRFQRGCPAHCLSVQCANCESKFKDDDDDYRRSNSFGRPKSRGFRQRLLGRFSPCAPSLCTRCSSFSST